MAAEIRRSKLGVIIDVSDQLARIQGHVTRTRAAQPELGADWMQDSLDAVEADLRQHIASYASNVADPEMRARIVGNLLREAGLS